MVVLFLRSGISLQRLRCVFISSEDIEERVDCEYKVEFRDAKNTLLRVVAIDHIYKIGDKTFFLYRFNKTKIPWSYWGVISLENSGEQKYKLIKTTYKSVNMIPDYYTLNSIVSGKELVGILENDYFRKEKPIVLREVFVGGHQRDNIFMRLIFPNYFNLIQIFLYEV